MRYTSLQTDILMRAGLRTFVLVGKAQHRELAENFVGSYPKVVRFLSKHQGPFMAKVHRGPGRLEMWLSEDEWKRARLKRGQLS